jgi:hypothetical protein
MAQVSLPFSLSLCQCQLIIETGIGGCVNVKILIDSIVRQTTVLIAQLATTGGIRAPLAHIANQVFLELSRELDAQGVSRKVSADMFGMALRTYLRKIQWLTESSTERGRTLWEAVLDYLSQGEVRSRAQVLKRFCRDENGACVEANRQNVYCLSQP